MEINAGNNPFILADGRWSGSNGIGRFSREVLSRLHHTDVFTQGPRPLSLPNIFWQMRALQHAKKKYRVFYTPGFNPVLCSSLPYVLTVHDLIHLTFPGNAKWLKQAYYRCLIKPAVQRAHKIITVSDYSKKTIVQWANIPEERVVVVSNGVSDQLTPAGKHYAPGFPYLLHVGNTKPHKNIERLIQAFLQARIPHDFRLILTGTKTKNLAEYILKNRLEQRVLFCNVLDDETLQEFYRGATALVFPSLYEGFGLPVIEAMACGTPVLTSNTTSLPEVAGEAALLVDPLSTEAIATGITKLIEDAALRHTLVQSGLKRVTLFSWEMVAQKIQRVLNEFA